MKILVKCGIRERKSTKWIDGGGVVVVFVQSGQQRVVACMVLASVGGRGFLEVRWLVKLTRLKNRGQIITIMITITMENKVN